MKTYQKAFIELALEAQALKFGKFTLKSGRVSPYFFNAGQFYTGLQLAKLGQFYAQALSDSRARIDMLFGPAYKGIPLVSATAIAFAEQHHRDLPYAYNRKEAKGHGEGGTLVGAAPAGQVAIIDDVITAGTAIREVLMLLEAYPAQPAVIAVGLDRQEKGVNDKSATQELAEETGVPVVSIIQLDDIVEYLHDNQNTEQLAVIEQYRSDYGVSY